MNFASDNAAAVAPEILAAILNERIHGIKIHFDELSIKPAELKKINTFLGLVRDERRRACSGVCRV